MAFQDNKTQGDAQSAATGAVDATDVGSAEAPAVQDNATVDVDAERAKKKKKFRMLLLVGVAGFFIMCAVVLLIFRGSDSSAQAAQGGRSRSGARTTAGAGDTVKSDQLNAQVLNEMAQQSGGGGGGAGQTEQTTTSNANQFREDYFPDLKQGGGANDNQNAGGDSRESSTNANANSGGLASQVARQAGGRDKSEGAGSGDKTVSVAASGSVSSSLSVRYAPIPAPKVQVNVSSESSGRMTANLQVGGNRSSSGETEVLPPFGTKIPVRVVGNFFAPSSSDAVVLLSVGADVSGEGWAIERGTLMVGSIKGIVASRRIEVAVFGYVNPATNKLVRVKGDVLGSDGGTGFKGDLRNRASILSRFGRGALQMTTNLAGGYLMRGAVPIFMQGMYGYGDYGASGYQANQVFVEVGAGAGGYVLIKTLPGAVPTRDADGAVAGERDSSSEQSDMDLARQIRQVRRAEGAFDDAMRRADGSRSQGR